MESQDVLRQLTTMVVAGLTIDQAKAMLEGEPPTIPAINEAEIDLEKGTVQFSTFDGRRFEISCRLVEDVTANVSPN